MAIISGIFGVFAVIAFIVTINRENFYLSDWIIVATLLLASLYFYKKKREIDEEVDDVKITQIKSKAIKVFIGGLVVLGITNVVFEIDTYTPKSTTTKKNDEIINGQTKEFLEWQVKSGEWSKQGK